MSDDLAYWKDRAKVLQGALNECSSEVELLHQLITQTFGLLEDTAQSLDKVIFALSTPFEEINREAFVTAARQTKEGKNGLDEYDE